MKTHRENKFLCASGQKHTENLNFSVRSNKPTEKLAVATECEAKQATNVGLGRYGVSISRTGTRSRLDV